MRLSVTARSFAEKLADDAFRREGVGIVVDAILDRSLREVVDVGALVDLITDAITEATVNDVIERHAAPSLQRFAALEGNVGELVPEASRDAIEALIGATRLPPFAWTKDVVEPELFAQLLAPVLSEWLMQFVTRLPGVGGLAGAFAKRMRKIASSGKDKDKDKGEDEESSPVSDRLTKLTVEFSKSTLGSLREALRARLRSEEGRAIIAEIRRQAFHNTMDVPLQAWLTELRDLPWDRIAEIAPSLAEQAIRQPRVQAILAAEIAAFVAAEDTLGELAERLGVLPEVRAYLRVQGESLLDALRADARFLAWLAS